jgi:glycosyltransferase involved in cell wall biosynthesis
MTDPAHAAPAFAIAIPAYQAVGTVADVVERSLAVEAAGFTGEVLVIDDGSTDGTGAAAREAGARVVAHPENQGKGRALATAFADLFAGAGPAEDERRLDGVFTLDADGQHLPEEVPKLVAAWHRQRGGERPALVLGSREHLFTGMSPVRRTSNRCSSFLISVLAGQRLADVQSGFRLYDRRLYETIGFPEPRFEAESAVVVRAVRAGLEVVTVPVHLGFADGRSTSHYRPLVDSLRIALGVLRARKEGYPWARRSW